MTVIANPIDANLLKAVKWAHLHHAFIIFFHPSRVQTGAAISWQPNNTSFAHIPLLFLPRT